MKVPLETAAGGFDESLRSLEIPALHQLAAKLREQADHAGVLAVLLEAARRMPDHPALCLDLLRAHHKLGDLDSAAACAERLRGWIRHQPADVDLLGDELQTLGLHDEAFRTFAILGESPVPQVKAVGLAREAALHLRLGNRTEAECCADEAFRLCPSIPETRSARALLLQETDPEAASAILLELAKPTPGVPPGFSASCGHRHAAVLDKLGRADEAMHALQAAKDLEIRHHPGIRELRAQRPAWRAWHQELAAFSHADAIAWADRAADPSGDRRAFLLGHPRSGTSLLEQILDAHPMIHSVDEADHFADHIAKGLIRMHDASGNHGDFPGFVSRLETHAVGSVASAYFDALDREIGPRVDSSCSLDKNPGLSIVVPLMARVLPHASVIVALRDPRDVCLSAYFQSIRRNAWSVNWLTLAETIEQYVFTMRLWLEVREKLVQPWIESRYEDLIRDPVSEGQRVTRFLGLDWHPAQADPAAHARGKFVRSPTHAEVIRPVYRSAEGRWRSYQKHFEPFRELLDPLVRAFGYPET